MIEDNIAQILREIPNHVRVEAAVKTRTPDEIRRARDAGITLLGENYIQEANNHISVLGPIASWHLIGSLQTNKAGAAARLFDMVESLGSLHMAQALDRQCNQLSKVMPVLIEVNSGRELQKSGVMPEAVPELLCQLKGLTHLSVRGLMTMGPAVTDPEELRPYFRETKILFDTLAKDWPMTILSMGMSDSYRVAIEEGATIVRLGTVIFGARQYF